MDHLTPTPSPANRDTAPSRLIGCEMLESAFQGIIAAGEDSVLLLISIDNLAMISHAHGYKACERLVESLCAEVRIELPASATIERVHIDQFAILMPRMNNDNLETVANGIYHSMNMYGHKSALKPLHIKASIGSVLVPENAPTLPDAIHHAYVAMRSNHFSHYQTFESATEQVSNSRNQMELASYIQDAIAKDRFRLAFQPIIETHTGETAYYECLLRLTADDGKVNSAGALIPVAELMGMIDIIDYMVLDKVVDELLLDPRVSLAFNVSSLTTGNAQWLNRLQEVLHRYPDVAPRLVVEITETAAHHDIRETAYFVASVQALGAKVSLDDFGSGYTSFRQLKSLSVDKVKIDGSFIRDVAENADNQFFVRTLLEFINGFGLEAVAECVETGEVAKFLMDIGVHYMQGYYFAKPILHRPWLKEGEYKAG